MSRRTRTRSARQAPPRQGLRKAFAELPGVIKWAIPLVPAFVAMAIALGWIPSGSAKTGSLQDSVAKSIDAGTSRMDVKVDSAGRAGASYTAQGAFDYRAQRGKFTYDFSGTPGFEDDTAIQARLDDHVVYVRFPRASGVPARRPWVRADLAKTDKLLRDAAQAGALPQAAPDVGVLADIGLTDPSRVLDDLLKGKGVKDQGEEVLFGVRTHRYQGTIRVPRAGARPVQATAWIGPDRLVRRLVLVGDGAGGNVRTTMSFSGYGVHVDAAPPPPGQITDLIDLLAIALGSA
jgi:hypothetical protein